MDHLLVGGYLAIDTHVDQLSLGCRCAICIPVILIDQLMILSGLLGVLSVVIHGGKGNALPF